MGNKGSCLRTIQPTATVQEILTTNVIEVKPSIKSDNSKCNSCCKTGKDFTVVSRDGTTITKMYYCQTCSLHWKDY